MSIQEQDIVIVELEFLKIYKHLSLTNRCLFATELIYLFANKHLQTPYPLVVFLIIFIVQEYCNIRLSLDCGLFKQYLENNDIFKYLDTKLKRQPRTIDKRLLGAKKILFKHISVTILNFLCISIGLFL